MKPIRMKICSRTVDEPACGTPDRYGWTCCGQPNAPLDTERARMIRRRGLEAVATALGLRAITAE